MSRPGRAALLVVGLGVLGVAVLAGYAVVLVTAVELVLEARRAPPGACPPGHVYVYPDLAGPPVCLLGARPPRPPR